MCGVHLISFADTRYKDSLERLKLQANKFKCFTTIDLINEYNLEINVQHLINEIIEVSGGRGYGYWLWKPKIILQKLMQIKEGDILLFLDAGCHLNIYGKSHFINYLNRESYQ